MSNQSVVSRQAADGEAAFTLFAERYYSAVLDYLRRLLADEALAEDLTQEAFLKLHAQCQKVGLPANVPCWLFCVAKNLCRDYWRSARFQKERIGDDEIAAPFIVGHDQVFEAVARREAKEEIRDLLRRLPEKQREIVMLRFFEERPLRDIAEVLSCPIGTVKSRLFQGLRHLRDECEKKGAAFIG
ncbi:RNA polymerase sigma factor [Caenibacillus caldisaponilyticus]|uniref:RNA polymerase sigma factor n=1 Tax=Caenibacillus caldisaponilyticus TaxID=1674942 RepID=UPI00098863B8|nr:RNA polymerase sigma factor [Caenibacillus caldisaponilyticus]